MFHNRTLFLLSIQKSSKILKELFLSGLAAAGLCTGLTDDLPCLLRHDYSMEAGKAYCEAFWLLEHLPTNITEKIPIDILLEIKSKRDRSYSMHFSIDGENEYLEDTLYYLDQLFRKYVPDMEVLLSDFCNNIPSGFDLNCIFEDDFE